MHFSTQALGFVALTPTAPITWHTWRLLTSCLSYDNSYSFEHAKIKIISHTTKQLQNFIGRETKDERREQDDNTRPIAPTKNRKYKIVDGGENFAKKPMAKSKNSKRLQNS